MNTVRLVMLFCLLISSAVKAQDAVIISEGNFVRGVIKGTNYTMVAIQTEDERVAQYAAKDIESFLWNGETYVSRPILVKKKLEVRFFKLIEGGAVNLYTFGEKNVTRQPEPVRPKIRPSIGIGMGSGGFGGGGMGGGISIGGGGGGRREVEPTTSITNGKIFYYIEKPGTGPMQEVVLENTAGVKSLLLQKLTDDEDLSERIKVSNSFSDLNLIAFIKAYNASKPQK